MRFNFQPGFAAALVSMRPIPAIHSLHPGPQASASPVAMKNTIDAGSARFADSDFLSGSAAIWPIARQAFAKMSAAERARRAVGNLLTGRTPKQGVMISSFPASGFQKRLA